MLPTWTVWLLTSTIWGGEPDGKRKPPTYAEDVASILQRRCQNCHRRHEVGPFPLETYEHARKRASDIAAVVTDRVMPPWKPARGVGPKLKHDQSLTPDEIATLEAWAAAGAPPGDPARTPPKPEFTKDWKLGPPDLVLEPAEEFSFPASGPDTYRCFVIPTNLPRDTYITAVDFRPGNPKLVHHINAFLDSSGEARLKDKAEPGPGYTSFAGPGIMNYEELSFWAAGHTACHLPPGVGQRLPRKSDLVLQVHYHATGKREVDRTRIGLYFARKPVKQALHWNTASNSKFQIPPGDSNCEVKASWYIPTDVEAHAVSPHMHALGRDIRIAATYPDGRTEDLIHIPAWDPSWQSSYFFDKPISIPAGSVVKVVAHYDNSSHPRNPNRPPKTVKWGFNAEDEMCEGFIAVVKKGQDLTVPRSRDDLADIFNRQRFKNKMKEYVRRTR